MSAQKASCVNPSALSPSTFPLMSSVGEQDETRISTILFDFSSMTLRTSICPDVAIRKNIIIMKISTLKKIFMKSPSSFSPSFESLEMLKSNFDRSVLTAPAVKPSSEART